MGKKSYKIVTSSLKNLDGTWLICLGNLIKKISKRITYICLKSFLKAYGKATSFVPIYYIKSLPHLVPMMMPPFSSLKDLFSFYPYTSSIDFFFFPPSIFNLDPFLQGTSCISLRKLCILKSLIFFLCALKSGCSFVRKQRSLMI